MFDPSPHIPAPIDPGLNRLGEILAARGIDPQLLNKDDGDPYSRSAIARTAIHAAAKQIPQHYQAAVCSTPDLHTWVDKLVAGAGGNIIPVVVSGPSVLLLGPTGVGKTFQAFGAIRDLAVTGIRARWVGATAADIYAQLRPRHQVDSETEFRRHADADLLFIDDLGAAKATEWTEEVNYRLINHRYEAEKPTLVTSNVVPGQLGAALGDRVASRLTEMCHRVALKGDDLRRRPA